MGRRLGQHFLTDPAILDRIVDALDPQPSDTVVEIGAGQGTLTLRLAPRVGRVIAIERDAALATSLQETARRGAPAEPGANVTVVAGDALALDWAGLVRDALPAAGPQPAYKVVGNIPYYVTSPLIDKALTPPLPQVVVYLVQREVAERLAAQPGGRDYGALTVGVQAAARVERLFAVRAGAFRPPPAVDAAAVRLTPLATPLLAPARQAAFRRFVTQLFSRRRKQLGRSLRDVAGLDREQAGMLLSRLGIPSEARPEVLSPQTLVELFRALAR